MKSQIERAAAVLTVFIGATASLFIASGISEIKEKEPDNATDDVNGLIFLAFLIAMIGYAHSYVVLTYLEVESWKKANLSVVDRFLFRWGNTSDSLILFPECNLGDVPDPYHTDNSSTDELLQYERYLEQKIEQHVRASEGSECSDGE
ncbi:hypothetical protein B0T25DRAFT_565266 [Lasiosphaeria hispida]|uniref:Uncharacterized protein n=1 Tax=Lasiosphaeria hispida TaxID=260671 RepID=A0AAJ0MIN1_9PEZI|nr:hypothetical protein B0T25DRAFT_565266 [Lasiosphaeria hispida]